MKKRPKPSYEDLEKEISRLKQKTSELYGIQEKYRQLVQSANSIVLRLTPQGDIKFINEFAQEFFGYREAEFLGRNVGGTIVPTRDSFGRDLAVMIKDIASHPERYQINENENMRNNSESVWIAWTNRIIQDEHGQISEIFCVGNDCTHRKMAEQTTVESEAQFRALAESAPAAIVIIAGEKILYVNPAFKQITGYTSEEALSMQFWEAVHPDMQELVKKRGFARQRGKTVTPRYEVKALTKAG